MMKRRDEKGSISCLQLIAGITIHLDEISQQVKKLRHELEKDVWREQRTSPHLARPVMDLQLSARAMKYLSADVKTIGELCQHKGSELGFTENRYLREIWDSLRSLGLVLKPDD